MKKKVILISIPVVIFAAFLIPLKQEKTIIVKASFFNVYQQLAKADNWKKWRNDLRQVQLSDSTKISDKKTSDGFEISYASLKVSVHPIDGYSFKINENNGNNSLEYTYTVLPDKLQDRTKIILSQKANIFDYLFDTSDEKSFSQTHIADFKNFMESVPLYYGYDIVKTKVTDTTILVLKKVVLAKDKFTEAAKNLSLLKTYAAANGLKQTQPLIAQFFSKYNDSVQLNIGVPVDRKIASKSPIAFMQMPAGNIYIVKFQGRFSERQKVYTAVRKYFKDQGIQMPILPFETYFDDKLPVNDTDRINIRINFPSF